MIDDAKPSHIRNSIELFSKKNDRGELETARRASFSIPNQTMTIRRNIHNYNMYLYGYVCLNWISLDEKSV